jgi:CubicO group peptidase (beta-lactamase class C family)
LKGYRTANIDDASNFAQRTIRKSVEQPWPKDRRYNERPLDPELLADLKRQDSAAFLVLQQGALVHETYFGDYQASSRTNSFSMAKTITTLQVALAVKEGFISSFDARVIERIPEYANDPRGTRATLAQLSSMTSGHDWTENYFTPLNITTNLYYGNDAESLVLRQGFEREPGTAYEYSSGSTQLMGVFLKRALEAREPGLSISEHLSRSLWGPLGMESNAFYTLDREGGMERTYCCIFATARDFAKIGQLLLQDGQWGGRALLDKAFVERMRKPDLQPFYGHSLWMDWAYQHPFYLLQGHQGQYVIVVPDQGLVIVRTGHQGGKMERVQTGIIPSEVYRFVDQAVKLVH